MSETRNGNDMTNSTRDARDSTKKEQMSNMAKQPSIRKGVVVSDKMNKTIVVKIDSVTRHPIYKKVIKRSRKIKAHDEKNVAKIGDMVKITETRPLSKDKRWRLIEVAKRSKED